MQKQNYFINVAVYSNIDNLLTYKIESDIKPKIGVRVLVPLGAKYVTGIIVEVLENLQKIKIDLYKIKPVKEIIDAESVISVELIKLGLWISDYYLVSPGITFSAMLSALHKIKTNKIIKFVKENEKLTGVKKEILEYVKTKKEATLKSIIKNLKIKNIYSAINELHKDGNIEVMEEETVYGIKKKTKDFIFTSGDMDKNVVLNENQKKVFDKIKENIEKEKYKTFLLYGITGSGKTEIYIKAAEEAIKKGKKVIILVPEIFLTPQIVERFKNVFGEKIAIYHSALQKTERLAEWKKMKEGRVDIVIGTRSAVFAPFENVGLIVVDEEFDTSYKQENDPRYNARDVAVYRGYINNATVILGSATPSLESYYNCILNKYELLVLPKRVCERKMPEIKIIDLKFEKDWQNKFLSDELVKYMNEAMENNEQIILFINRRGFSNYIFCHKCGFILKCENCEIPLVYHLNENVLKCHYCNIEKKPIQECPKCGTKLFYKGLGTQKIENVIKKFFPDKRIARIDIDSMKGKKQYFEIYRKIKEKEIDIIIGTQMIAKGFDLPEVTLVGVVNIDNVLNLPDFRAEERVFQLLLQVAGRTGRGDKEGRVVIQTFSPESLGIKYVKNYETENFYKEQLEIRKTLEYPPFVSIIQIILQDKDMKNCEKKAEELSDKIQSIIKEKKLKFIKILGPAQAPLVKIKNKYRFSIILKSKIRKDLNILGKEIKKMVKKYDLTLTVDPVNTL